MKFISHIFLISLSFVISLIILFIIIPKKDFGSYKGKLNSCIEYNYVIQDNDGIENEKLYSIEEIDFNEFGLPVKEYTYDENDSLLMETIINYKDFFSETKDIRNHNNKVARKQYYKKGERFVKEYDINGKLKSKLIRERVFISDDKNKSIYETYDTKTDKMLFKETYRYDDGEILKYKKEDTDGKIIEKHSYKYDDRDQYGNWTDCNYEVEKNNNKWYYLIERDLEYHNNFAAELFNLWLNL